MLVGSSFSFDAMLIKRGSQFMRNLIGVAAFNLAPLQHVDNLSVFQKAIEGDDGS